MLSICLDEDTEDRLQSVTVLVDTGFLVALFDATGALRGSAKQALAEHDIGLADATLTCLAGVEAKARIVP